MAKKKKGGAGAATTSAPRKSAEPVEAREDEDVAPQSVTTAGRETSPQSGSGAGMGTAVVVALVLAGVLYLVNHAPSAGSSADDSYDGERYVRSSSDEPRHAATDESPPSTDETPPSTDESPSTTEPERLTVRVIGSFPHDARAFTQGLEYVGGELYEGTGIRRRSTIRRVALESGEVLQSVDLPPEVFGEGITVIGDRIWQISWVEGRAFLRNRADFSVIREVTYEGEGWGLCHDETRIVMSDGSDQLFFRDPETFALTGSVHVTLRGEPIDQLNELECVAGVVYANVWQTDDILRIDPATGVVTGVIDTVLHAGNEHGRGMLEAEEAEYADVLNGIAWMPDRGHFLVGGKEWPRSFEVEFVPTTDG